LHECTFLAPRTGLEAHDGRDFSVGKPKRRTRRGEEKVWYAIRRVGNEQSSTEGLLTEKRGKEGGKGNEGDGGGNERPPRKDGVALCHWEARVIRGDVRGKTQRLRSFGPVNGAGPQDDRFFEFRNVVRQAPMREAPHAKMERGTIGQGKADPSPAKTGGIRDDT
jgi:hypothetical protein